MRPELYLLHLNLPIFEQLQLEEALLRTDKRNFCILNQGSPRAIVMGISGKPEELLNQTRVKQDLIPVIRRFSGGGTVIVDPHTLFITFIVSRDALPFSPFPEPILRWSADLYQSAWQIPGFTYREYDYVIQDRKCGGNAQYIRKDRWLHHTSFLWDFDDRNMEYLLLPQKRPQYRGDRSHCDFLCRLKEHANRPLISQLKTELINRFTVIELSEPPAILETHRKSTDWVSI